MKSTREKILRTLLAFPGSTINDLAEAVGINGISVRHHLTTLEAEDMVTSSEERHGVGRPRLIYSLTEKGLEAFPSSYLRLTQRLIKTLKGHLSPSDLESIFKEIGSGMADSYAEELDGKSVEERLQLLKPVLTQEGFIVEWQKNEETYTLKTLSCPYYRIGQDFPEVCALDLALISEFLNTAVIVEACIFDNAQHCIYQIHLDPEEA